MCSAISSTYAESSPKRLRTEVSSSSSSTAPLVQILPDNYIQKFINDNFEFDRTEWCYGQKGDKLNFRAVDLAVKDGCGAYVIHQLLVALFYGERGLPRFMPNGIDLLHYILENKFSFSQEFYCKMRSRGFGLSRRDTLSFRTLLQSGEELPLYECRFFRYKTPFKGLMALSRVLKVDREIKRLLLDRVQLSAEGIAPIADAIRDGSSLFELHVTNCPVEDRGVHTLAEVLKQNSTLQILNLSGSKIGDRGCISLMNGILPNTTLKKLDLSNGRITDVSIDWIQRALITNTTLTSLNLRGNNLTKVLSIDSL